MKVHEIAHCRAGDKGDISVTTAIVYNQEDYAFLCERLTVDAVKEKYGQVIQGSVTRYPMENVGMLIFEMKKSLGGGVTRSLRQDGHGKNFSSAMMDIELGER